MSDKTKKFSFSFKMLMSLGKTLYGTFPCLVVLASCSKLKLYLLKFQADSNILASREPGRGNCLPNVLRLRRFPASQENKYRDTNKKKK